MIGGFLFIKSQNPNALENQLNDNLLKQLGPAKSNYSSQSFDNGWIGQMTLDFFGDHEIPQENGYYIVGSCLLNNRKELGFSSNEISCQEIILKCYLKWGNKCLDYLEGEFTFVIWNPQQGKVFSANSKGGSEKYYYYQDKDIFIIASEVKAILPFVKNQIFDSSFIAGVLASGWINPRSTLYKDVYSVPRGYSIDWSNDHFTVQKYHQLSIQKNLLIKSYEEALEAGNDLFSSIINGYASHSLNLGLQFGAGLGSAYIASELYGLKRDFNAVSYVLPDGYTGQLKDGRELIDSLRDYFNMSLTFVNEQSYPAPYGDQIEQKFWAQDTMIVNPNGSDHDAVFGQIKSLGGQLCFTGGGKNVLYNSPHNFMEDFLSRNYLTLLKSGDLVKGFKGSISLDVKMKIGLVKRFNNSILNPDFYSASSLKADLIKYRSLLPTKLNKNSSINDQLRKAGESLYHMPKGISPISRRHNLAFINPYRDYRLLEFSASLPTRFHQNRRFSKDLLQNKVPDQILQNTISYNYPVDLGQRWMNLKGHLKEHYQSIPKDHAVWSYINKEKVTDIYSTIEKGCDITFWRKNRTKVNTTILLYRFLEWQKTAYQQRIL